MNEKEKALLSFYKKSIFLNGIFEPTGYNILPKLSLDENSYSKYKLENKNYGVINFNGEKTFISKDSYEMTEEGNFSIYERKKYILKDKPTYDVKEEKDRVYSAIDIGNYSSNIRINKDFNRASINTRIFVKRFTSGINYGGISVRDSLFTKLNHTSSFEHSLINEYFVLLQNGNLLHYTDNSNLFEVYETNIKTLKEGIKNISSPKIYDLNNKDNIPNIKNICTLVKKKNLQK